MFIARATNEMIIQLRRSEMFCSGPASSDTVSLLWSEIVAADSCGL